MAPPWWLWVIALTVLLLVVGVGAVLVVVGSKKLDPESWQDDRVD